MALSVTGALYLESSLQGLSRWVTERGAGKGAKGSTWTFETGNDPRSTMGRWENNAGLFDVDDAGGTSCHDHVGR